MKTCTKCHIEKPESEFHKSKQSSSGLYSSCKSCVLAAQKSRYYSMTNEQRLAYNGRQKDRYHGIYHPKKIVDQRKKYGELKQSLRDIKSSRGCLRCGESDPYSLDFHHVGEKLFEISKGKRLRESRIGREISKCVVLCSNCHRKLHAERWTLLDCATKIESDYPEAFTILTSVV